MTENILTPQPVGGKKFRRWRIYRLTRHRPRQRSAEECIQIWEKEARRRRYIRPKQINQSGDAVAKGRQAEALVADWLKAQGYQVETADPGEHHDLVLEGVLQIEVKFSTWNEQVDRGRRRYRYQWRIHPEQVGRFHMAICIARNGEDNYFFIPAKKLGSQKTVTIRTFDPAEYTGKWSPFLGAKELLEAALDAVRGEASR